MPAITLTHRELELARTVATERMNGARSRGQVDRRIGPQDGTITDLTGTEGELALAKLLGVYPDWIFQPQAPDDGADLTVRGVRIDVKVSLYRNPRLLVAMHKRAFADIYFLFSGERGQYRPVGWAYAHEIISKSRVKDLGHGPTYAMEPDELHPAPELVRAIMAVRERKAQQ